jgi:hypothetical protein
MFKFGNSCKGFAKFLATSLRTQVNREVTVGDNLAIEDLRGTYAGMLDKIFSYVGIHQWVFRDNLKIRILKKERVG